MPAPPGDILGNHLQDVRWGMSSAGCPLAAAPWTVPPGGGPGQGGAPSLFRGAPPPPPPPRQGATGFVYYFHRRFIDTAMPRISENIRIFTPQ